MSKAKYTIVTQAAKTAAREERRLKYFLTLSAEIYRREQDIKHIEELIETENKRKAVRKFEFNLNTPKEHPDFENKKKSLENDLKRCDDAIKNLNDEKAFHEKEIAATRENQDKVVSGETKMDYDAIIARARELISQAVEKGFLSGEYDKEPVN